jgi:hypothetical protein
VSQVYESASLCSFPCLTLRLHISERGLGEYLSLLRVIDLVLHSLGPTDKRDKRPMQKSTLSTQSARAVQIVGPRTIQSTQFGRKAVDEYLVFEMSMSTIFWHQMVGFSWSETLTRDTPRSSNHLSGHPTCSRIAHSGSFILA